MNLIIDEQYTSHTEGRRERAKLVGFSVLMLVAGATLAALAGPPRLPSAPPDIHDALTILRGSSLPIASVLWVLVDLAWLLWIWIVGSLCLGLALVLADTFARGAAWVRALHGVFDRVSVPLVRRVVAAAFAVQILSRGVPVAAAQPIPLAEATLVVNAEASAVASKALAQDALSVATYLVRPGDTLWSIAERAYGSGTEYRRVLDSNLGRRMPDGQVFSALGVIQPGWQLLLPGANSDVEEVDGHRWYTVRAGDTLRRIATALLDDSSRWDELFDLNRGATTPDGLHTLSDANVIWPGLRLQMPDSTLQIDEPTEPAGPEPVDLIVASAPQIAAGEPTTAEVAPPADDPRPLLRTPHDLDPLVLEPADSADPAAESEATPLASDPIPVADAEVAVPNTAWQPDLRVVPLALGGLGLAAGAGLAFGALRMRRFRPLPQEPENDVVVQGGFAEAQLAHDLTRGLHGVGFDPLESLVRQLEQFLAEYNLVNVGVVAVRHGRSSTTISLRCGLAEQAILVDLAPVFAERLEAEAEASVSADQDVSLRLTRLRRTRLLPPADVLSEGAWLVPLGVLYDRQVYSAAWSSLGHILVVSPPGHGADTILTSLVATLTARRSPGQLRLWILGSRRSLPRPLLELPHLARIVEPAEDAALAAAADDLRAELDWRATHQPADDLVVVVPELASLGEQAARFAVLASHAAQLGVRLFASSTSPDDALASPMTRQFTTRMVLRMQAEESSVALLGVADAAFLGGGGRLLLRVDGRQPVELYGYQVTPEHLERLVRVMRSAYAAPPGGGVRPPDTHLRPAGPSDSEPATEARPADANRTGAPPIDPQPPSLQLQSTVPRAPTAQTSAETVIPPLQVFCFGGPRVVCGGQQVWPRQSGGDAKPWEFLLYLACQPAEGVSRDQAVEALWPEDEVDDAAHRFRQLRYRLRRLLVDVPGAPGTDGVCLERGNLRLDPGVTYSDAQEFLTLVRSVRVSPGPDVIERLERARALYEGDLLAGPDAHRYAWIHERDESGVTIREHFRRLFEQATLRLAELYTGAGALDAAVALYRQLTEMDPADERLWLALFRMDALRGDRMALVRDELRFRESLRELAEIMGSPATERMDEPSREVAQEFQRLLASIHDRDRQPATA